MAVTGYIVLEIKKCVYILIRNMHTFFITGLLQRNLQISSLLDYAGFNLLQNLNGHFPCSATILNFSQK